MNINTNIHASGTTSPAMLRPAEVCRRLSISRPTLQKMIANKEIAAVQICEGIRIPALAVDDILKKSLEGVVPSTGASPKCSAWVNLPEKEIN
jgi:excisionase family DNA binding protein